MFSLRFFSSGDTQKEDVQAQKIRAEMLGKEDWEDVGSSRPVLRF